MWNFKFYYKSIIQSAEDQLANSGPQGSAGPETSINLYTRKIANAMEGIRKDCAVDIISDNPDGEGRGMVGMQTAIASGTAATYGKITPSVLTNSQAWRSRTGAVTTATLATLSFDVINGAYSGCVDGDTPEDEPDLILCDTNFYNWLQKTLQPNQAYWANMPQKEEFTQIGFRNQFKFRNAGVFVDRNLEDNYPGVVLILNTRKMHFVIHPFRAFKLTEPKEFENKDAIAARLRLACLTYIDNRKCFGKITGVV